MLTIMGKKIDIKNSTVLYQETFTEETLSKYWNIYSGEWYLEDEWLTGNNPDDFPALVISKQEYPGNVLLEFEARTVPPCDNDINALWNVSMQKDKDELDVCYVMSMGGWWEGKVGLERIPGPGAYAMTPLFKVNPGQIYHVQTGSIDGHCFLFIDGKLIIEMEDSNPIDNQKHTKVGFDAYASHIQIRNVTVREIKWEKYKISYAELRNNDK